MEQFLDDPNCHGIIRSFGASGLVTSVIWSNGIIVQTIVVDTQLGFTPEQIAVEHKIDLPRVHETLAFYNDLRQEIDANIYTDHDLTGKHN
jgi:uncharacterized protein (DUF433 family)